jgi:hypothetical protein
MGKQSVGSSKDFGKFPSSVQHSIASPASSKNMEIKKI